MKQQQALSAFAQIPGLSRMDAGDIALLQQRLWAVLSRRGRLYTMNESSSMPVETAQELFASVCFLLSLYLRETGRPVSQLLLGDLDEVLDDAIHTALRRIERARRTYEAVCMHPPCVSNAFLTQTVGEIGVFFRLYDVRFFAHQIPCGIDYRLCVDVPETLCGVEFIDAYLDRLLTENLFLSMVSAPAADRVLHAAYSDYQQLPLNLFRPVFANAAGLVLLGEEPEWLCISDGDRAQLARYFDLLTPQDAASALRRAAGELARRFGQEDAQGYFEAAAAGLYPDIRLGLSVGKLGGVFPGG